MGSANKVPICSAGCYASDCPWVVPVPGLTGFAITSLRSHNLMEPTSRLELFLLRLSPLGDFALPDAGHGEPGRSRRGS